MCNVICTNNTGNVVLFIYFPHLFGVNNKTMYVLYNEIGSVTVKQPVDVRESSSSRCTWQARLMPVSFGAGGLSKATRYREIKDEKVLCVRVCTATGLRLSTV